MRILSAVFCLFVTCAAAQGAEESFAQDDVSLQDQYALYFDDVSAYTYVRSVDTYECTWIPITDNTGRMGFACSSNPLRRSAAEAFSTQNAIRQLESEIRRLQSRINRLESRVRDRKTTK